jgi:tetratricopeptide (TPR) repeat protein
VDYCRRAVALSDAGGDPALRFECLHGLLHILLFSGSYAEVESGVVTLLALGETLGDAKRRGNAIMLSGSLLTAKGDWRGALERYERVLALCQGEEHWVLRSNALNFSSRAWEIGMDPVKSRALGEAAFELVWRHGNLNRIAVYQANLAESDWFEGALESARRRGESAIEAGRKSGDQHALNWALAMDAQVHTDLGDNAAARRRFEGALAIAQESGHPIDTALARQAQGQLYLAGGVETPGDEALEGAARVFGDADFLLVSLATAAQVSLRGGARPRAEALAREILADARGVNPGARSLARALLSGLAGDEAGIAAAVAEADATRRVPVGFAARLTAAEALLLAARPAAALRLLDELEPRARALNFQGTLAQTGMLRRRAGPATAV